ncbi:MAG TPA: S9 family peptidase [Candidatus Sulfotelmatobacter sp.]|nr:S9 family peptidase [Candidatus Sulfotelmatobacter sp.]
MSVMTTPETVLHAARKGPRPMTAEDLWAIPRVGAPIPSPDGSRLAVAVTTYDLEKNEGRSRLWILPAMGGEPVAFTGADMSSSEPAFSPDGKRLAFIRKGASAAKDAKSEAGAGKPQLFVMPLDGGEPRQVTRLPLGAFDPTWLPDGKRVVVAGALLKGHLTVEKTASELERREKDPVKAHVTEDRVYRYWDRWLTTGEVPHLFVVDVESGETRDLTPDSTLWFDFMEPSGQYDVSPDGREIAFAGIRVEEKTGFLRSAIWTVPVQGGAMTCLTPDHPAGDLEPRYRPDGRAIVYGMQHDPLFYADRVRVMEFDRGSGTHREIAPDWKLSPTHWRFAPDGTLFFETEDNARTALFALRGEGTPKRLVWDGTIGGVRTTRERVFFTRQTLSEPPEVHSASLDGSRLQRLTQFTEAVTSRFATGEVREMTLEGAYGEIVQMFVVFPPDYQAGRKYPLLMQVHGGPHAISGDTFLWRWNSQVFSASGYITALINFQGSTSWGQDFAQRIQGSWGDRPLKDTMAAVDALVAAGLVDESRMAMAGGSYGGYMASWIEAQTDRFKCIINHAGVFDLIQQYGSDVTQGRARSMGGEAWDGLDRIDRWNPARNAAGFKTPMLVIHGERDYRVPVGHALECYGILKAKGVPARLVYFPDENHWVLKARNSIFWYGEFMSWLKRWVP